MNSGNARFNSGTDSNVGSTKGEVAAENLRSLLALTRALYATPDGGVGCCNHLVLDDHNWETPMVDYCLKSAIERKHPRCEEISSRLLRMSKTQRLKFLGMRFYR